MSQASVSGSKLPIGGHIKMCSTFLPLYHTPAASANVLIQITGGKKIP